MVILWLAPNSKFLNDMFQASTSHKILFEIISGKQLAWEQFPDNRQSVDSKEKEFGKNQNDQETTNILAVESLSRRQKVSINFGMP